MPTQAGPYQEPLAELVAGVGVGTAKVPDTAVKVWPLGSASITTLA